MRFPALFILCALCSGCGPLLQTESFTEDTQDHTLRSSRDTSQPSVDPINNIIYDSRQGEVTWLESSYDEGTKENIHLAYQVRGKVVSSVRLTDALLVASDKYVVSRDGSICSYSFASGENNSTGKRADGYPSAISHSRILTIKGNGFQRYVIQAFSVPQLALSKTVEIESEYFPGMVSCSESGDVVSWCDSGGHAARINWLTGSKVQSYSPAKSVECCAVSRSGELIFFVQRDSRDELMVLQTKTSKVQPIASYEFGEVIALAADLASENAIVVTAKDGKMYHVLDRHGLVIDSGRL